MALASAPACSRCWATPKVAAVVLAKVKLPVSVRMAAYRQPAMAGVTAVPEAMASS
jgi:hypothetical protein